MFNDFIAIYDLYRDAIFRYCHWKSGDRGTGEDLTQETFLRYWSCLKSKREIAHTRAFLYRIAHNLFVSHVRRKREASLDRLLETGYEPTVDPWQNVHSRLDALRPVRALRAMRAPFRKVLHQRFVLGLSPSEIALLNGETANTVSVRMFQGLKHLRLSLNNSSPPAPTVLLSLPPVL
ncbi:MAG: RNA polymerase sigma factor [Candidatus Peribacteraceae bacterium]|nr:RNA polymerase sigma factor [Candidatus Peribacteraceae bacterium]